MSLNKRPVIWLAESHEFSQEARLLLQDHCHIIDEPIQSEKLLDVLNLCDGIFIRLGLKINGESLPPVFRCKYFLCPATGIDHINLTKEQQSNVTIFSLKGQVDFLQQLHSTAEHTLALIFALLRNIYPAIKSVKQGAFDRHPFKAHELYGKKVGIVGFGRLGQKLSNYVNHLGANSLVYDIDQAKLQKAGKNACISLDELLSQSDIVSLHVDLNEQNHNMVDLSFLTKMKPTAILINTSRGQLIHEGNLIYALEKKIIAAAALDVVQGEPSPNTNNELFQYAKNHDNLIITPHIGGYSYESLAKAEYFIVEQFIKQLRHG